MSNLSNGYIFPRENTKKYHILNDLMGGADLTPMKALAYGTHRLAAVVHELKHLNGFDIVAQPSIDSAGTLYTMYYMPMTERLRAEEARSAIRNT